MGQKATRLSEKYLMQKKTRGMAEVVECLSVKLKALNSKSSIAKTKIKSKYFSSWTEGMAQVVGCLPTSVRL
jgi:hypothetical protein